MAFQHDGLQLNGCVKPRCQYLGAHRHVEGATQPDEGQPTPIDVDVEARLTITVIGDTDPTTGVQRFIATSARVHTGTVVDHPTFLPSESYALWEQASQSIPESWEATIPEVYAPDDGYCLGHGGPPQVSVGNAWLDGVRLATCDGCGKPVATPMPWRG